jgi:predicted protein tyrosine phosphatase
MIHVCSLSKVDQTVARTGAQRLLSLLAAGTEVVRPGSILAENHLHLVMHDIAAAQDGMTMPGEEHVRALLDFAYRWDRAKPMVVHCYAGVSRSTASAYIIAAALAPKRDVMELAQTLRFHDRGDRNDRARRRRFRRHSVRTCYRRIARAATRQALPYAHP